MTGQEFREAIYSLTDEQLASADKYIHLGGTEREQWITTYTTQYVKNPQLEARCVAVFQEFGLDVKTEKDKITDATVRSADAAEKSANAAVKAADTAASSASSSKWSAGASVLAAAIALAAFIASILRGCGQK